MQIVIDIPEDVYTRLFDNGIQDNEIAVDDVCEMAMAIRKGTPLPEGHGDLVDRQALIDNGMKKGFCDWYDEIKYADTIIEADQAESEG